jgi:hypothetical protein
VPAKDEGAKHPDTASANTTLASCRIPFRLNAAIVLDLETARKLQTFPLDL